MATPTTTTRRSRPLVDGNGAHRSGETVPRLKPTTPRRNTAAIVVAVLSLAGGALAGLIAYKAGSGRQSVLAATRAMPAGHVLQASDLRVVDVSTDGGLALVLASDEGSVIGRPVGVPLAAGAPLSSSELGSVPAADVGQAVVGVLCKAGQYPPSIAPGDTVEIVDSGATTISGQVQAGGGGVDAAASPLTATVIGVDAPADTATVGTVISLRLSARDAPAVSRAAAAGRISLILVHPGG